MRHLILILLLLPLLCASVHAQLPVAPDGFAVAAKSAGARASREAFFNAPRKGAPDAQSFWNAHLTAAKTATSGNWQQLGPTAVPFHSFFGRGGIGRINVIKHDPGNTAIIWVGSPSGGLWRTSDGGSTWAAINDHFDVLGISDIAFRTGLSTTMYLATGDADGNGGKTYSIGVLKSTDSGQNWAMTGLNWSVDQERYVSRLLAHPTQGGTILAATSEGIYRTSDGGTNWNMVRAGDWRDLEVHPSNQQIMYASGTTFVKSTDGGITWTQTLSNQIPAGRIEIAVSPADPNLVDILICNQSSAFYAHYRSTNAGDTWNFRSSSPNILSSSDVGGGTTGLGRYALVLATAPNDTAHVIAGSINLWESTNGGNTWSLLTYWETFSGGGQGRPIIHADQHDLLFDPVSPTTIWAANDGGIYKSTDSGTNWQDLSNGLPITQMYRIGTSQSDTTRVLAGTQDNGTLRTQSGSWEQLFLGDGMECLEDPTNASTIYFEFFNGAIAKSTNNGVSYNLINGSISETGAWVTPFVMHPTNNQELIAGYDNVWRTTNGGTNWTQMSNFISQQKLRSVRYAPDLPNTHWLALTLNELFLTTDGGSNWTDIAMNIPGGQPQMSDVGFGNGPNPEIWVGGAGYAGGDKVFRSTDLGQSWANISGSLPNLPVNTIVQDTTRAEGWYVGMDVGVYAWDPGLNDWANHSTDLPNVIVHELEVRYADRKVVAGTYGRGLWASDLYVPVPISVEDGLDAPAVTVWPNPASDVLRVSVAAVLGDVSVAVFDVRGKKMGEWEMGNRGNAVLVPVEKWQSGMYIVRVQRGGNDVIARSIIIQH